MPPRRPTLVRSGEASPLELVEAAIERVERVNPELNAVITPLFERRSRRRRRPTQLPDGPLRGVPFVLKDLSAHSAGDPFHEGMAFLKERGWTEPEDTVLAARFRAAGLVTIGKTNTPELGILPTTEPDAYGPTRNPWDTTRSTGGSSGGSAAAVAAGLVPIGHANDGGGSIRIPASECGLVGLKPTRARCLVRAGVRRRHGRPHLRAGRVPLGPRHRARARRRPRHGARRPVHGARPRAARSSTRSARRPAGSASA